MQKPHFWSKHDLKTQRVVLNLQHVVAFVANSSSARSCSSASLRSRLTALLSSACMSKVKTALPLQPTKNSAPSHELYSISKTLRPISLNLERCQLPACTPVLLEGLLAPSKLISIRSNSIASKGISNHLPLQCIAAVVYGC